MTLENLKWLEFKVKTLRFGLNLEEVLHGTHTSSQ